MTKFPVEKYYELKFWLASNGYEHEIGWAENVSLCTNPYDFVNEAIWVIVNSGMKEQIARKIYIRIMEATKTGSQISTVVFRHYGKVKAINDIIKNCNRYFEGWVKSKYNVDYLQTLPFVGGITKYHLAKNLGLDFCKPDRHLERVAKQHHTTPEIMCKELAEFTTDRIGVVDIVLWRACNLKLL